MAIQQIILKFGGSGLKILLIIVAAVILIRISHSVIRRVLKNLLKAKNGLRPIQPKTPKTAVDIKISQKRMMTLEKVFYSAIKLVVWAVAFLTILPILGINIAPLLAGLGIGGLALGFGARSLVQDYISGLFILLEDQYRVGEEVEIAGTKGRVEDFSLRRTALVDESGVCHYIPNSQVKKASNFSRKS